MIDLTCMIHDPARYCEIIIICGIPIFVDIVDPQIYISTKIGIHEFKWFGFGLVLWCLMPLSTIFIYIMAVSFIDGGNRSTRGKPDQLQVTYKLYHLAMSGF